MTVDFEILCNHPQDSTVSDYYPLDRDGVISMLRLAKRHEHDSAIVSKVQVRLTQAVHGMTCPRPDDGSVAERSNELDRLFIERFAEGPSPDLVDQISSLIGIHDDR